MHEHPSDEPCRSPAGPQHIPWPAVALVVAIYLILGLVSAFTTPWDWRAAPELTPPDESAHLQYIQFLAQQRTLPTFTTSGGNYEAHQPPVYYLAALIPYLAARSHGEAAAVHAVRVFSVLIGAGLILVLHGLARSLFPRSPALQLAIPAFAAFLPMHVAVLSAINNDGAAELLTTAALYVSVVGLRRGFTAGRSALLGALLGAAVLTKMGALLFVPVGLLAVAYAGGRAGVPDSTRLSRAFRTLGPMAICVGIAAGMTVWWLGRNQALYGDPLAQRAFRVIFNNGTRRTPDWFFTEAGVSANVYWEFVALQTFESFWGVFGQANQFMGEWFYLVGALLILPPVIGLATAYVLAHRGRLELELDLATRHAFVCLGLALVLVVLAFLKFNSEFFQAQARYLFPAIAPIAVFFCYGWGSLVPHEAEAPGGRRRENRGAVLAAVLAIILVMCLSWLVPRLLSTALPTHLTAALRLR